MSLSRVETALRESGVRNSQWFLSGAHDFNERQPVSAGLGFKVLEILPAEGLASIGYAPDRSHLNIVGKLHGGLIATMLDDAAGVAACAVVGRGFKATTNLALTLVSPARAEAHVAVARVIGASSSLLFVEARLETDAGELKATAQITAAYGPFRETP